MKNNIRIETEQATHMIDSLTFLAQFAAETNADLSMNIFADVFELIRELNNAIEENKKEVVTA